MRPLYNDTHSIAEEIIFMDTHICQMAQLAHQKIRTYKLSLVEAAYKPNHDALYELVKKSLFSYVTPAHVLNELKFNSKTSAN